MRNSFRLRSGKTKRLRFEALEQRRLLTVATDVQLQITTNNGDAQLVFNGPQQISAYQIGSASNQLIPANWSTLNSQGHTEWLSLSTEKNLLSEVDGNFHSSLSASGSIDLGNIFTVGGAHDLTFQWGDANSAQFTSSVVYVTQASDLTIAKNHSGTFRQGDGSDPFAIIVTNSGNLATSGAVTVTDTLPAGLTYVSASGTGWKTQVNGSTVTASRSDVLNAGVSYPALTINVSVANNAAANLTNAATVAGGGETNTSNDSASDQVSVTQVADLTISMTHTASFQQGDTADNYTIVVGNAGPGATSGTVTVTDTLPAGLSPVSASGGGWATNIVGSTVTATRSDQLTAGANYPALTLTVSVANNAAASITNTATVSGGGELNLANDSASDVTTITVPSPDLTITKSHTGTFRQGDAADSYTIAVTNAGSLVTSGTVTVTDTLPAGLTPTAANGTGWTTQINNSTVTATRSDSLAKGSSYPTLTITASVANNAPSSVTNTASVSGAGEVNLANDSATDIATITQVADLTISKSHSGNFRQGDAADAYTISVNNTGAGPTTGTVTVTDILPAGLTPTAASGSGWTTNISGSTVTATRSDALVKSASYPQLTITVSVAANAAASITNTVTVSGGGEVVLSNDSSSDTTSITQVADLTIAKSHSGNFRQGDAADAYTLTVNNAGTGPTTGTVTVTDTLPAGLTPTAASGSGWTTQVSGSTVTATRTGVLVAGASYPALTITVNVAGNAAASVINTATVSGGGELNAANDSSSDPTTITPMADLTIGKTHLGPFRKGDTTDTYTITVANSGSAATSGTVTVTDTMPTGLTPTAASGTGWTTQISGTTVTATRSDSLVAGANYPAITVTVSIGNSAASSVTNTATVAGGGEINTANDSASDTTTITQVADLTITKSHTGIFVQDSTAASYTITVNNAGLGATSGQVTVTDTLPTGLTPTAATGSGWTTQISGSTVTATRSDVLAAGGSYPTLTITATVANGAPASVTNMASVAGGGELNAVNDTASDTASISAANCSLAGYVYVDGDNSGQRINAKGQVHPGLPGVTVKLLSQDSSGNWGAVSGKSPVVAGSDGSYQFTGLSPALYRIQIVPAATFNDGKVTAGKIGGTTRGTTSTDQIDVQVNAGENGTEYDFAQRGLRPKAFSLRYLLSSAPSTSQILQTLGGQAQLSAAAVDAVLRGH